MRNAVKLCAVVLTAMQVVMTSCRAQSKPLPAVTCDSLRETPVVTTECGDVVGVYTEDMKVRVYAGIPYASPPVGELRWKAPQAAEKWKGVLKATHFSPIAMQPRMPLPLANKIAEALGLPTKGAEEPMSEDCLYLNVWTPESAGGDGKSADESVPSKEAGRELHPVLVYFHGGSLRTGAGSEAYCRGESAARAGVVMVTVNYRLGVFGFLSMPELSAESGLGSGNYGLLDQIFALQWVRRNIKAFGGDPARVTIAGESAGSQCVSALCVSPLAKGLFCSAIGESATFACPWLASDTFTQEKSERLGLEYMKSLGKLTLEQMRALPAEVLVKKELSEVSLTVDGFVLPESVYQLYQKGRQNDVPLLIGYNAKEGGLFTIGMSFKPQECVDKVKALFGDESGEKILQLYPCGNESEARQSMNKLVGAFAIGWPTDCWARIQCSTGKSDVYKYYYTYKQNEGLGANHGTEMEYAYHNPNAQSLWKESDYAFSEKMFSYWMNFVKWGTPNGKEGGCPKECGETALPVWKSYKESPHEIMEIGDGIGMMGEPNQSLYDILNTMKR